MTGGTHDIWSPCAQVLSFSLGEEVLVALLHIGVCVGKGELEVLSLLEMY